MKALDYVQWRRFKDVINKAIISCNMSNTNTNEHFAKVGKPIKGGNGNIQIVEDYKLSRYACYLIAQNGDSRKKVVALAQNYFAIQTRKMEIIQKEYFNLSEEKTIKELGGIMPENLKTANKSLKQLEKEKNRIGITNSDKNFKVKQLK